MSKEHSFFIPDQDLLVDLDGLIGYLGEKIAGGNLCLYCPNGGKEFNSTEAVRKHMIDKSHCKIAYETDEDRAELADFYAFEGLSDENQSDWEDVEEDGTWDEVCGALRLILIHRRFLPCRVTVCRWSSRQVAFSATAR